MYLVHIYAYPYKYTYIQVLMAQNSCISQPYPPMKRSLSKLACDSRATHAMSLSSQSIFASVEESPIGQYGVIPSACMHFVWQRHIHPKLFLIQAFHQALQIGASLGTCIWGPFTIQGKLLDVTKVMFLAIKASAIREPGLIQKDKSFRETFQ